MPYNIIGTNSNNTGSSITFDDCEFTIGGTNSSYIVYGSTGSETDVTITDSSIGGDIRKAVLVYLSGDSVFTFTGNTVTDDAPNENGSVATIVMQSESAQAFILNNTMTDLYRGFCIDNSTASGSWTIASNVFINTDYALNFYSKNDANANISMAYNFFGETVDSTGTTVDLLDESNNTTPDATNLTLYPYYTDADLTTLVYDEDGTTQNVTDVAIEALGDLDIDSLSDIDPEDLSDAQIDAITLAAYLVVSADMDALLEEGLLDDINALDALFAEVNSIDVAANVNVAEGVIIVEDDLIDVTEVSGLALAVYGNGTYIAEATTLTLEVEQIAATDDADFTFTAVPYVSINNGTPTKIDNDDLNAPITFVVYLPDSFEGNYATVLHKNAEGDEVDTYTLYVYTDRSGDRYIQITVTEFSTFYVTGTTVSSSTSVRNTYYDIEVEDTDNGEVTVSSTRAVEGKTITITATPDEGYEVDEVIVLDEGDDEVDVDDEGDGEYTFEMPDEDVTIEVTFVAIDEDDEDEEAATAFLDVDADAYYYDAVLWAVEEGITNGMTEYLFAPDTVCTRAQAVTFLWNAAGNPTVFIENPFADVAEDAWYYEAVLWAVSEGITSGTTETTFAPDSTCTRAQIVTFLWNAAGNSTVDDEMDFADVAADSWYAEAVRWAVSEEITTGMTSDEFAPATNCTRGQIVTFLYRYLGE